MIEIPAMKELISTLRPVSITKEKMFQKVKLFVFRQLKL